jgi:hypothetical protein
MSSLIVDICKKEYGAKNRDEGEKVLIEIVKPEAAPSGFLAIQAVIACPCGLPINLNATSPDHSVAEVKAFNTAHDEEEMSVIELRGPGATADTKQECASNVGHTTIVCPGCERQFISCWEITSVQVDKNVTFPWDDSESPSHPSSGASYSIRPRSTTLH